MSDIDPTDIFSEFDDGEPGTPTDGAPDSVADSLARLDAAVLLESLSTSDLVPDFGNADDSHPDAQLFEEPPIKEGDTDVPRLALGDSGNTPLPVPSRDKQGDPLLEPVALSGAGPSAPARPDDLTPDFARLMAQDEPFSNSDESPPKEEASYHAAVTPTLPMLPSDAGREDFVRSELITEPAPPDVNEMEINDTTPTGPAAQGDVVVRVFFPRPPGEEPPKGRAMMAPPPPFAAKAAMPVEPEEYLAFDADPEMPAQETDLSKIETRPHPRPAGGEVIDILAGRSASTEPKHVPVIQEFSWSDLQEPIVQESFARDDEPAAEPVEMSATPVRKSRRRGIVGWLVVGTIVAVLLIAVSLGLWGVLGQLFSGSLAGLFGPRATPTPPFGVLLEPTAVTETEPEARSTASPMPQPSPTPEPPAILTDEGIVQQDIPMVFVPGGSFEMGSDAQAYRVTLSPYYIDTFEVTNEAYARCVAAGACTEPQSGENYAGDTYYGAPAFLEHPVINVTWDQASIYCQWRDARLPTEAEWEMAARVDPETGVETIYPWGGQWDPTRLNYCDASCVLAANADPAYNDTWPQTARVGSFASGASGVGAMDLAGNVSEWVADWFAADYYLVSPEQDPGGPNSGQDRVIRGGAWGVSNPELFLSTARTHFDPATSGPGTGFRCAASAADIEGLPTDESQEDT